MKISIELKVGVLAVLCAVILYFGLNFLQSIYEFKIPNGKNMPIYYAIKIENRKKN